MSDQTEVDGQDMFDADEILEKNASIDEIRRNNSSTSGVSVNLNEFTVKYSKVLTSFAENTVDEEEDSDGSLKGTNIDDDSL